MITYNQDKFKKAFEAYKESFESYIDQEIFKWKAVKQFQDNWDIEAPDFAKMLSASLASTENLLAAQNTFPRRMIKNFSKADPEAVRTMFRSLYDESRDVFDRIEEFAKNSEKLLPLVKDAKNHFQNLNAISTYLWLRYPNKYFIFKYLAIRKVCDLFDCSFSPQKGLYRETVESTYELLEQFSSYFKQDDEFIRQLNRELTDDCDRDINLHTAVIDFIFFVKSYYISDPNAIHYWMYSPGPMGNKWEECKETGAMLLAYDELQDFNQYSSKEEIREQIQSYIHSEGNCNNHTLAVWEFAHKIKLGDVIFAKKGMNTILGKGIVTGKYYHDSSRAEFSNVIQVKWEQTGEWECTHNNPPKTLTDITPYDDFVEDVLKIFQPASQIPVPPDNNQYWWLTANPKIWSAGTGWKVGEEQEYTLFNDKGNKRKVFQNFLDAKVGDKIICYESTPTKQIVGFAEISKESDGETIGFIKRENLSEPIDFSDFKDIPELKHMEFLVNPNGSFFKVTSEEYATLMDLIEDRNSSSVIREKTEKYSDNDFLKEVYVSKDDLHTLKTLLKIKKNLILQGAPGVGKTFSALRLAYTMMGEKDNSRVCQIQFHQNYSYEDFVMGYKPEEEGFKLKNGIFYNFCIEASNHPDKEYFLIIDEINRGNLSKIFGELLMLIENSYRGRKINLAYNGKAFFVPENLYIIGMMNTADRSLAMIDYALRRRFSFFKMKPGFDTDGFIAMQKKIDNAKYDKLISRIKDLNDTIRKDDSLGEGFEIGHSYFCIEDNVTDETLDMIVNYDIIPMLEEYWFDNNEEVSKWSKLLRETIND